MASAGRLTAPDTLLAARIAAYDLEEQRLRDERQLLLEDLARLSALERGPHRRQARRPDPPALNHLYQALAGNRRALDDLFLRRRLPVDLDVGLILDHAEDDRTVSTPPAPRESARPEDVLGDSTPRPPTVLEAMHRDKYGCIRSVVARREDEGGGVDPLDYDPWKR